MITIYRDDVTQLAAASRDRTFSNSPEALSSSRRRQNNEARSQMIRNASHDCPKAKRVLRLLCAGQPRRRANQSCFTARPPLFPPASERPTPSSSYPTTINIFFQDGDLQSIRSGSWPREMSHQSIQHVHMATNSPLKLL